MSDKSKIEWTDTTWNPITGCSKVSQGCKNCYALREWPRLSAPRPKPNVYTGRAFTDVQCHPERLDQPLRMTKPRRIFVNSMSDLFHDDVPDEFIAKVFAVMARARHHVFQVLTKRPGRMLNFMNSEHVQSEIVKASFSIDTCAMEWVSVWPLPNVWLGVSVEDQATADERIPLLLQTPAAVRWISAEPLLGPIDLRQSCNLFRWKDADGVECCGVTRNIHWCVAGGESGPSARPSYPDWFRSLRDQCQAASVQFFFKQWGEHWPAVLDAKPNEDAPWRVRPDGTRIWYLDELLKPRSELQLVEMQRIGKQSAGRILDGRTWDEYPQ